MSVPAKRELQPGSGAWVDAMALGFDECPCEEGTATGHPIKPVAHATSFDECPCEEGTATRIRMWEDEAVDLVSMSVPAKRELQRLSQYPCGTVRIRCFDECPCEEGTATGGTCTFTVTPGRFR